METALHLSHNGWTEEETQRLWQEIEAASQTGAPLRGVFERMGQALGRKPNSVRNYYYMRLRAQGDEALRRAQPFETFTDEEIHDLLRSILSARAQGQSVRSCVTALAGGDRTNNVEGVRIASAPAGTYDVRVRGVTVPYDSTEGGAAALYMRGAFKMGLAAIFR